MVSRVAAFYPGVNALDLTPLELKAWEALIPRHRAERRLREDELTPDQLRYCLLQAGATAEEADRARAELDLRLYHMRG